MRKPFFEQDGQRLGLKQIGYPLLLWNNHQMDNKIINNNGIKE